MTRSEPSSGAALAPAPVDELSGDVLVHHAGDERLVWDAFLERPRLDVTQLGRGQSKVHPAVLCTSGTRRGTQSREFLLVAEDTVSTPPKRSRQRGPPL